MTVQLQVRRPVTFALFARLVRKSLRTRTISIRLVTAPAAGIHTHQIICPVQSSGRSQGWRISSIELDAFKAPVSDGFSSHPSFVSDLSDLAIDSKRQAYKLLVGLCQVVQGARSPALHEQSALNHGVMTTTCSRRSTTSPTSPAIRPRPPHPRRDSWLPTSNIQGLTQTSPMILSPTTPPRGWSSLPVRQDGVRICTLSPSLRRSLPFQELLPRVICRSTSERS